MTVTPITRTTYTLDRNTDYKDDDIDFTVTAITRTMAYTLDGNTDYKDDNDIHMTVTAITRTTTYAFR